MNTTPRKETITASVITVSTTATPRRRATSTSAPYCLLKIVEKFARGALTGFDSAVHIALPALAGVLAREHNASGASGKQRPPRWIKPGIDERIAAPRPRVGSPVGHVHSNRRRAIHA